MIKHVLKCALIPHLVASLYLVLAYGVFQEWALLAAAAIKSLGYAYMLEVTNKL